MFTVARVNSIHDTGTAICDFPTAEAANRYMEQLEEMEADEMAVGGYWYEVQP